MLLYEINNDILEVYDFSAKKEVLEEYRKRQMQKIPEDERILIAETRISNWSDTPLFESFSYLSLIFLLIFVIEFELLCLFLIFK